MIAHILLNLLNELLAEHFISLSLRLINLIIHEYKCFILFITCHSNHIFGMNAVTILPSFTQRYNERLYVTLLTYLPLVVYLSYCMAFYPSQTRRHVIAKTMVLMNITCWRYVNSPVVGFDKCVLTFEPRHVISNNVAF